MTTRILRFTLPFALTASLAMADFKFEQHSKMTGGSMLAMMKMAGRFSKTAREAQDTTLTVAVKGNKMVNLSANNATIYDLDQGVLTSIDFDKKTYSVVTFEEMKAFMEKNMKKAGAGANMNMQLDVKETGRKETVLGMAAKEVLMTAKVEATDPQTGKKGEMQLEISNWMAAKMPGQDEMMAFYKKMGESFAQAGFGGMMGNQPGMSAGMAEAAKKLAALDGTNIVQVMRMIPTDPQQIQQMEQAQAALAQAGQNQAQMPSAKDAAGDAAGQAAASAVANKLGRLGGLGGGLGGFGRNRKKEEPPPPPPPPAAAPAADTTASAAPVKGSFSSEVSMMEMTIESKNFSSAPVDASMFSVPAGFKQVKSPMQN